MHLLQALAHLLSAGSQSQQPDITYNPNPYTDVPYSAHTPELAQMGNQYAQNPHAPQLRGIDPGLFGYPADGPGGVNPNNAFRQLQGTPQVLPRAMQGSNPALQPAVNAQRQGPAHPSLQPALNVNNQPNNQQIRI